MQKFNILVGEFTTNANLDIETILDIESAIIRDDMQSLKLLLKNNKNLFFTARTLAIACRYKSIEVVKILIDNRFNFDCSYLLSDTNKNERLIKFFGNKDTFVADLYNLNEKFVDVNFELFLIYKNFDYNSYLQKLNQNLYISNSEVAGLKPNKESDILKILKLLIEKKLLSKSQIQNILYHAFVYNKFLIVDYLLKLNVKLRLDHLIVLATNNGVMSDLGFNYPINLYKHKTYFWKFKKLIEQYTELDLYYDYETINKTDDYAFKTSLVFITKFLSENRFYFNKELINKSIKVCISFVCEVFTKYTLSNYKDLNKDLKYFFEDLEIFKKLSEFVDFETMYSANRRIGFKTFQNEPVLIEILFHIKNTQVFEFGIQSISKDFDEKLWDYLFKKVDKLKDVGLRSILLKVYNQNKKGLKELTL